MSELILDFKIYNNGVDHCVDDIYKSIIYGSKKSWLACFNPHSYAVSLTDSVFNKSLQNTDWLVPDGVGVVLASKILGGKVKSRITGSDVFESLNFKMNKEGNFKVMFLGSTQHVLDDIKLKMSNEFPRINVVGTYSPPFKDNFSSSDVEQMINYINKRKPDVLWVGLTAPKQEKWIFTNIDQLDIKFAAAIGAVFDFYSGNIVRSSPFFQSIGLEWLPRFIKQPRRLWRRNFISAPIFFSHVIKDLFNHRKNKENG